MTTKSPLHRIMKKILHTDDENKHNHERTGTLKPHEKDRQTLTE
jgi:hypothetical protein